jgi:hypothetical protein
MESDAYKLGSLDAALELGLTKESGLGHVIMPALGAAAGYALAPEGEEGKGALMGGLGAYGLQSAIGGKGKAPVPAPAAPVAKPHSMEDVGAAILAQGKERAMQWLNAPPTPKAGAQVKAVPAGVAPPTPVQPKLPPGVQKIKDIGDQRERQQGLQAQAAKLKRREYLPTQDPKVIKQPSVGGAPPVAAPLGMDPEVMAGMRQHFAEQGGYKKSSLEQFKLAVDIGGSIGVPGMGGLGISMKDQKERLPGMSRWVPHAAIERGFEYADSGFDPEAVMDAEGERGSLLHPALGAALAAAGAAKFAPKSGVGGALLAGLGGAGLGSAYHHLTGENRRQEGLEAFEGAQRERAEFPIRRHKTQTANEASPLTISRGHGDA